MLKSGNVYRLCVKCHRVYGCVYYKVYVDCQTCSTQDCEMRDRFISEDTADVLLAFGIEMTGGLCDSCTIK